MFTEYFVHCEHVNPVCLKHQLHLVITPDLALVIGILEISSFDVIPDLLDDLKT